jgi:indole-3-glycerol phosphate synthase
MILERILESKRVEVAQARVRAPEAELRAREGYGRRRYGFAARLQQPTGRRIIAEIKKSSPSKGVIRADFDPVRHAREYQDAGAACLSVLTDGPFFLGSLDDLRAVRGACGVPLLRKDFVIDAYQITEAREAGADAILLIVAALDDALLADLQAQAIEQGLDVLVEVHDEEELEIALRADAKLIGINNRNLKTFATSIDVTRRLMMDVPSGVTVISESGLSNYDELADLERLGVSGFLIGEAFMAADAPGEALAALLAAGDVQER